MKVLVIHDFYQQFGGEDAVALSEMQLLEKYGNEVIAYTRHNDEIKCYGIRAKMNFFPETIFSLRTRRDIAAVVRRSRPDVAYIHNIYPLISPSVYHTLYSLGIPSVQVLHDSRPLCVNSVCFTHGHVCEDCKYGNYLHAIRLCCYRDSYTLSALYSASLGLNRLGGMLRKIGGFVCLTQFTKRNLLDIGVPESKLFVKPNFIDPGVVVPSYRNEGYVVYLGRLPVEKGVWTLVRAFEQMRSIPLKIMGTGPEEIALKNFVYHRKLTNVEFVGFKSGQEKLELLRNSLFVIAPSEFYEMCPVSVLEAYAAGKPVIGSDLGALPYVVRDGRSGLLARPGCVSDLVEKVRYLAERPAAIEAMGRYARKLAETEYSPDCSYATLMAIFNEVSQNGTIHPVAN